MGLNILLVIIFCLFNLDTAVSATYRRPSPEVPVARKPYELFDLFSYGLAYQIHSPLFSIDKQKQLKPILVESFKVSEKGLLYSFKLKSVTFKNGDLLNSTDVKRSIAKLIENRGPNYVHMTVLKGYSKFLKSGNLEDLKGIELIDSRNFNIRLTQPSPDLLQNLSDIYFSIWKEDDSGKVMGLGDYSIESNSPKNLILKLRNTKNAKKGVFDTVIYELATTSTAIKKFEKGYYSDLFMYSIPEGNLPPTFKEFAANIPITHPRTYYLALNANRLTIEQRKSLVKKIRLKNLIAECYRGEEYSTSWIPVGYPGFSSNLEAKNKMPTQEKLIDKKLPKDFALHIISSIGAEVCLKKYLSKNNFTRVSIQSLTHVIESWQKNSIDAFIGYMDGTSSKDFFAPLDPESTFLLGDKKNTEFARMYNSFSKAKSLKQKHSTALELAENIKKFSTVIPIFSPRIKLFYQRNLNINRKDNISPITIPISEFRVK